MSYRYASTRTVKWANKLLGDYQIGEYVCRGYDFEDASGMDNGPCPPLTYNNFLWSIIIEPQLTGSSLWWNERRVCLALRKWAMPGFGYLTTYEAYAAAYRVPPATLPFSSADLASAFRNFESTRPPACHQRVTNFSPTGGQRWGLDRRAIELKRRELALDDAEKSARGFEAQFQQLRNHHKNPTWPITEKIEEDLSFIKVGDPPAYKMAYDAWTWKNWLSDPYYKANRDAAFQRLKISDPAEMTAFDQATHALLMSIPGGEPEKNVRYVEELIQFFPGKVVVNPWVVKFVRAFADRKAALKKLKEVSAPITSTKGKKLLTALKAAVPAKPAKR